MWMTSKPVARFLAAVGRTLGKAVIAGVGMELAKIAGSHLHKRFAPKDGAPSDAGASGTASPPAAEGGTSAAAGASPAETARLRDEVAQLRSEVAALRRAASTSTEHPVAQAPDGSSRG